MKRQQNGRARVQIDVMGTYVENGVTYPDTCWTTLTQLRGQTKRDLEDMCRDRCMCAAEVMTEIYMVRREITA